MFYAGDNDFLKVHGEKLIESCVDPFIIRHPKGHTVPRLGKLLCLIEFNVHTYEILVLHTIKEIKKTFANKHAWRPSKSHRSSSKTNFSISLLQSNTGFDTPWFVYM